MAEKFFLPENIEPFPAACDDDDDMQVGYRMHACTRETEGDAVHRVDGARELLVKEKLTSFQQDLV